MLTLINSLLDLARLEDGHMPLQLSAVNVKELVESSLKQVTVWAGRNHVTLDCDLEAGVEMVYTDAELTMRVLVNLLSNAISSADLNQLSLSALHPRMRQCLPLV
jgi:signal transduction histidine kinase